MTPSVPRRRRSKKKNRPIGAIAIPRHVGFFVGNLFVFFSAAPPRGRSRCRQGKARSFLSMGFLLFLYPVSFPLRWDCPLWPLAEMQAKKYLECMLGERVALRKSKLFTFFVNCLYSCPRQRLPAKKSLVAHVLVLRQPNPNATRKNRPLSCAQTAAGARWRVHWHAPSLALRIESTETDRAFAVDARPSDPVCLGPWGHSSFFFSRSDVSRLIMRKNVCMQLSGKKKILSFFPISVSVGGVFCASRSAFFFLGTAILFPSVVFLLVPFFPLLPRWRAIQRRSSTAHSRL